MKLLKQLVLAIVAATLAVSLVILLAQWVGVGQ